MGISNSDFGKGQDRKRKEQLNLSTSQKKKKRPYLVGFPRIGKRADNGRE